MDETNRVPTAVIAPFNSDPPAVDELSSFVLDATSSEDPDGDTLTYAWQQIAGPPAAFPNGTTQATLNVVAPKVTDAMTATFRVTVDDGHGGTDTADIEITVNEQPTVVYIAQQENADAYEVYRRHATDDAPVKLHADASFGAVASTLSVSPDRRYVAYLADREGDGGSDLYVARLDGQGEQRFTSGAAPDSVVAQFLWAPDSSRIAFLSNLEAGTPGVYKLFVARPDYVGGRTEVSGVLVDGGSVLDFRWAPNSASLAFRGFVDAADTEELFVAPAAGGARVKVSGTIVEGGNVAEFDWSPDGQRIAVRGELLADEVYELFVVRPDNAEPRVKVSGAAPVGGSVWEFRWSPDSESLAFFGPIEDLNNSGLYIAALDGSGRMLLSGATDEDAAAVNVQWMGWSPDSERIVFWGAQPALPNRFELYSAPRTAAGERVKISGPSLATSFISPYFIWHPDGERIAYVGDLEVNGRFDVYVAAADGGGVRTKLFGDTVGASQIGVPDWVEPIVWSPDGEFLAFSSGDVFGDGKRHLLTVGVGGGDATAVSGTIANGGNVNAYQWLPDGSGLVFAGDLETDGAQELFRADRLGGLPREKVSGPLAPGGVVGPFVVAGPQASVGVAERQRR